MRGSDIPSLRLYNQHLTHPVDTTPSDVTKHLGAIQAQDYAMAKWAVGQRMLHATDEQVETAFNKGEILRTHVMRPTWHFVLPEHIRWMQQLTSNRVKTLMGHYNKKLELDEKLFKKSNAAIVKALRENTYLTRQELKTVLNGIGITTDIQRLAHIIMWAELDQLICSGPRRGKQFTYALLEKRVPKTTLLDRENALEKLALTYFTSHGPAQLKDFAWWSGLTVKDAYLGLDAITSKLNRETIAGKTYWFANANSPTSKSTAFLLSIYDEYTIAYKDRSDISEKKDIERMISMGNALTAVIVLNGVAIGTWKRKVSKTDVTITVHPFKNFSDSELNAVEDAARRYGKFLGLPVVLY